MQRKKKLKMAPTAQLQLADNHTSHLVLTDDPKILREFVKHLVLGKSDLVAPVPKDQMEGGVG